MFDVANPSRDNHVWFEEEMMEVKTEGPYRLCRRSFFLILTKDSYINIKTDWKEEFKLEEIQGDITNLQLVKEKFFPNQKKLETTVTQWLSKNPQVKRPLKMQFFYEI